MDYHRRRRYEDDRRGDRSGRDRWEDRRRRRSLSRSRDRWRRRSRSRSREARRDRDRDRDRSSYRRRGDDRAGEKRGNVNANIEITTPTLNESEVMKDQDEGKYSVEEEEDDDDEVEEEDSDEEAAEERARAARKKRREAILAKYRSSKVTADDAVSVENKSSKPNAALSSSKVSPRVSKVVAAEKKDEPQQKFDIFDMSSKPIVVAKTTATMRRGSADHSNLQDNWDDADGYYTAQIGEVLNDRYKVTGHSGQGVFSSVLFCTDTSVDGAEGGKTPSRVAIKIIRANETMRKASETELKILKEIAAHEHVGRKFNIRLIQQFSYRNHVCLVFEALQMNLRVLLKKFAKGVGISIAAVRRFSKQLFLALRQLRILDVVHADLKPDNILVTGDHQSIKICDFGSAFKVDDGANQVTPYLVSRFYRGPEIILGLPYDTAVDIWSAGCCIYEMFSSKVLFSGRTNNLMIDKFMHIKGPIPRKMVRAHLRSYEIMQRMPFFNDDFHFRRQDTDPVTKQDIAKLVTYTRPTKSLGDMLNAHLGHGTSRKLVNHLRDLLEKTLLLDPARRITAKEALEHPFLRSDVAKTAKKKKAFDATRGWR